MPYCQKGFHQKPDIDFSETFNPVVDPVTIKLLLTMAFNFHWLVHQLDINNAFLNEILQENIYMA